ncbi:hypothetical protein H6G97_33425 [Nostoc flagelliforme FACHB-838]|uniref:Uncharacterized protein n=1 Tax=Nostoc flagelliforme FACHB-838 TaxID=2692904 RepID=A0ABR8DXU0_9NOSO|nr:hypothetical protein [Nostoc flagelliforme FACHB-838]
MRKKSILTLLLSLLFLCALGVSSAKAVSSVLANKTALVGSSDSLQTVTSNIVNNSILCGGTTSPGNTNWKVYDPYSIFVEIDTSSCNFTNLPLYTTSLGGLSEHYVTTGATSIYHATKTGFVIYVRRAFPVIPIDPVYANDAGRQWVINWVGIRS